MCRPRLGFEHLVLVDLLRAEVLNLVLLDECEEAGLTLVIVHASKIVPIKPDSGRIGARSRSTSSMTVAARDTTPQELMQMFEGVSAASSKESRAAELAKLPLLERLAQRIVDGERTACTLTSTRR